MNPPEGQHSNNNLAEPMQARLTQDINKPQLNSTDIGESNSLAKVRDILFGNQMHEVEKRFNRLEERLVKESTSLRDETRKRLDSLEIYIKKEVESLTARVNSEQAERNEVMKALADENKNINTSLEKKLAQIDGQATSSQRELREQILNQSKNIQDDIQQRYEEILALLQQEYRELRKDKTDRSTLVNLFTELAIRLNSQQ